MRRTGGHRSGQVGQTPSETENSGALLAFEWAQEAQGLHLAQEVFEIPNRGLQILVAALGATRGALFESPSNGNRHVRTVVGKAAEAMASKHVQVSGTSIVPANPVRFIPDIFEVPEFVEVWEACRVNGVRSVTEFHLPSPCGLRWTIAVYSSEDAIPSEQELRAASILCALIQNSLERWSERNRLEKANRTLRLLSNAATGVAGSPDWREHLDGLLSRICETLEITWASAYQVDEVGGGTRRLARIASWGSKARAEGLPASQFDGLEIQSETFRRTMLELERGGAVFGVEHELDTGLRALLQSQSIQSVALLPILSGKKLWGVFVFCDTETQREWSSSEIEALQAVAHQVSAVVEAERAATEFETASRKLARVLDALPDVVLYEWTPTRCVVSANAERLLGYSADEFSEFADLLTTLVHPDDREFVRAKREEWSTSGYGGSLVIRYRMCRKDGSSLWVEDRIRALHTPSGNVHQVGLLVDFSEQYRVREALQAKELEYENLVESLPIGVWVYQNDTIAYANIEAARIIGADDPEEVIGRSPFDFIHASEHDATRTSLEAASQGSASDTTETTLILANGTTVHIEVKSSQIRYRGRPAVQIVMRDITEQKVAEQALRQSEYEYRRLVERLPIGVIIHHEGIIQFCNPAMAKMLGVETADALIGKSPLEFVHADSLPTVLECIKTTQEVGIGPLSQFTMVRRDGTEFPVETIAQIATFAGRQSNQVLVTDITERKRAEDALRASEERFRQLADNAPVLIWTTDARGQCGYFNKPWLDYRGTTLQEEIEGRWETAIHPEDHDRCAEIYAQARRSQTPYSMEYRLRKHDGEYRWFLERGLPNFDSDGNFLGYIGSAVDIHVRKEAERELRESRKLIEEIVDDSPFLITITASSDGKVTFANKRFDEFFGRAGAHSVMRDPQALLMHVHAADRQQVLNAREATHSLGEGETHSMLVRISNYEAQYRWAEWRTSVFERGPDGQPTVLLNIIEDVTDRKELEAQLARSQRLEAMGRLAGGIAHDFNNLLSAIIGYADVALRKVEGGLGVRHELEQVTKAGERAADLTRHLLSFARRQVGKSDAIDVNSVLSELLELVHRTIGEDISLVTRLDATPSVVLFDSAQLEQVVLNLVVNARDAMPNGGRLMIETESRRVVKRSREARLGVLPGNYVVVSVTDTGVGMDEAARERIFEPFFTTKEPGKGTGLGLATCHGIVKQAGGNILVESSPGAGARFDVFIPLSREHPTKRSERTVFGAIPRGHETILIVEDEPMLLELSADFLQAHGYRVLTAQDARAALRIATEHKNELNAVITDVVMPQMSGVELASQLRDLRPNLPILFVSGYSTTDVRELDMASPVNDYVQKPFTPSVLARRLRALLDVAAGKS